MGDQVTTMFGIFSAFFMLKLHQEFTLNSVRNNFSDMCWHTVRPLWHLNGHWASWLDILTSCCFYFPAISFVLNGALNVLYSWLYYSSTRSWPYDRTSTESFVLFSPCFGMIEPYGLHLLMLQWLRICASIWSDIYSLFYLKYKLVAQVTVYTTSKS